MIAELSIASDDFVVGSNIFLDALAARRIIKVSSECPKVGGYAIRMILAVMGEEQ
jgi:hypothetical protein